MGINIGRSQTHLPHGDAQRLRERVALVESKRELQVERLRPVRSVLMGTAFGSTGRADRVEVIEPWGHRVAAGEPESGSK